jgi:hypothetical protein
MMGDRLMLENEYRDLSELGVARIFGTRFAASLFQVEPGEWQGPNVSEFGLHLVQVYESLRNEYRIEIDHEAIRSMSFQPGGEQWGS